MRLPRRDVVAFLDLVPELDDDLGDSRGYCGDGAVDAEGEARVEEGFAYDENGVRVTAFRVDHGPFKPALGYRVDYKGHSIVISGDTRPCDNLVEHAMGADVLIHNAWVNDSPDSKALQFVSSTEEAGEIFKRVKPRLAVITHYNASKWLRARTRTIYKGKLVIARDLTKVYVGTSISMKR